MGKIIYDNDLIKLMALFEKITNAKLKDAFQLEDQLIFVVQEGEMGKALGRNKSNVYRFQQLLKKRFKIVEYSPNLLTFIVNLIYPLKIKDIKEENKIVIIAPADTKTRGFIIGRNAQNLRNYELLVKKYFDITEIKVV